MPVFLASTSATTELQCHGSVTDSLPMSMVLWYVKQTIGNCSVGAYTRPISHWVEAG